MIMMSMGPTAAPSPEPVDTPSAAWCGGDGAQYILNVSTVGAAFCLLFFLLVWLRGDRRLIPSPSALLAKLLAVYHADVDLHCGGGDASRFLHVERSCFSVLVSLSLVALAAALPLNLHAGVHDGFDQTTAANVPTGSLLIWVHFLLMIIIAVLSHFALSAMEETLQRVNNSDSSTSIATFTIMVQGIPKPLAADKQPLEEYFSSRYPDKVHKVIVPFDLCALQDLTSKWTDVHNEIAALEDRLEAQDLSEKRRLMHLWRTFAAILGFNEEDRLKKLQNVRTVLEAKLIEYREERASGAGIAFVVFTDVRAAKRAVTDFRTETKKKKKQQHQQPAGEFFPLLDLQLECSRWRVVPAPPASDIYWSHLGFSMISQILRRMAMNACVLAMLIVCSLPVALISAMKSTARIMILQFMPNAVFFMALYVIIPSVLSYLCRFERHLTASGEQCAAFRKMVCFYLLNLVVTLPTMEKSLEMAILGEDCEKSFLSRSSLSSLAFLITSIFSVISFDLLALMPWLRKTLKKFRKNDMIQLVSDQNEDCIPSENQKPVDNLRTPLMPEGIDSLGFNGVEGQVLSAYPIHRSFHAPKQTFDFAQYHAFNLTVFALTLTYSLFAPLAVPVGAIYFGYRYVVDKHNFMFACSRVHGFSSGNGGKLMDAVLCVMHMSVVLFLFLMLLFFAVEGDSAKLQAIFTLGVLFSKLLLSKNYVSPTSVLEGMQTVESFVDGPTDYEVFSQPDIDWDVYQR